MTSNDRPRSTWGWRVILLACIAGIVGMTAPTAPSFAAKGPDKKSAALQEALDRVVAAGAPGAVVLVRDGDHTTRLASGLSNLSSTTPTGVGETTRIGGMTKTFTATVILQLVNEEKVALTDTVEKWVPGVISNGNAITVRQLLNHTSGIADFTSDPEYLAPYYAGDLNYVFEPDAGIQIAANHGPLFTPGTGLAYSNTNYLLLAKVAEAATRNSIASELQTRIFEPLGLSHTTYATRPEEAPTMHGYLFLDDGPYDVTPWTMVGAAGAIVTNADDLSRFYRALLQGRLLPHKLLKAMQTIDPVATGGVPDSGILGGGWGLGLLKETLPCGQAWGHDSENPGYMTATWSSKDGKRQVVVMVNTNGGHDEPVPSAMRDVLTTAYCGH